MSSFWRNQKGVELLEKSILFSNNRLLPFCEGIEGPVIACWFTLKTICVDGDLKARLIFYSCKLVLRENRYLL